VPLCSCGFKDSWGRGSWRTEREICALTWLVEVNYSAAALNVRFDPYGKRTPRFYWANSVLEYPAQMSKREPPNQEAFDKLLRWLNPDREQAGGIYENIRVRLIKIFAAKGCFEAEDLADETLNVVASKIDWLIEHYEGNPALYFYGVARNIYFEHRKKRPPPDPPPPDPPNPDLERACDCLDRCLEELGPDERSLAIRYQEDDKQKRIAHRKQLADEFQITRNALRIRVFHIHSRLEQCVEECLQQLPVN
jgi:DNA-directed RNA polymerase specialized sigma24 family protein